MRLHSIQSMLQTYLLIQALALKEGTKKKKNTTKHTQTPDHSSTYSRFHLWECKLYETILPQLGENWAGLQGSVWWIYTLNRAASKFFIGTSPKDNTLQKSNVRTGILWPLTSSKERKLFPTGYVLFPLVVVGEKDNHHSDAEEEEQTPNTLKSGAHTL